MKHIIEIELGIAEIMNADWRNCDRWGKQERVEFLTTSGELLVFPTEDAFKQNLPANAKTYLIGKTHYCQIGRTGHRSEYTWTFKVVEVLR